MTSKTDIVNRALQAVGTRTTVTDAELAGATTNEAKQANLVYESTRDELLRMAPWDCGLKTAALTYITSLPGTPENQSPATAVWSRGQPMPPWVYEYQYPVDCLKALWVVPQLQTTVGGVPIYPVSVGTVPMLNGPPQKFKVATDQFYPVIAATVANGGAGYAVGDIITLVSGAAGVAPIGAPAQLRVETLAGSAVATASVVNQILGESTPVGGSYFQPQTNPVAQGSTTGVGAGATFNLTFGPIGSQRVILTNAQSSLLAYIQQVTDPNVMDPLFIDALVHVLGAKLAIPLTGDRAKANDLIQYANKKIEDARVADANEGLTVNDFTPDWIRARGYLDFYVGSYGPYVNWGGLWPSYL